MTRIERAVFFWLLAGLLLFAATKPAFADDDDDEVDSLLNRCEIAPAPEPSAMVCGYELNPETLMPGDIGVLTVTLNNGHEKTLKKEIRITTHYPDVNTEAYYTMDAYIKEAYIVERSVKIYNRYISAGVIGPDKKVNLEFKIKAPGAEGIYMLKFVADIEDVYGKRSSGIHYFIPVQVSGAVNLIPRENSENEVKLEVINEGLSDVSCVYVTASDVAGAELQPETVYAGKINAGDSAIVVFNVINAEEGAECSATFKATFKHGINKHESNPVYVNIPCAAGVSEATHESENAFVPAQTSLTPASSPSPTSSSKLGGYGALFTFAGLLVSGLVSLARRRR
ncbi:MAG: hypothetical protein WAV32_08080 [Halobacteriota archaeon]